MSTGKKILIIGGIGVMLIGAIFMHIEEKKQNEIETQRIEGIYDKTNLGEDYINSLIGEDVGMELDGELIDNPILDTLGSATNMFNFDDQYGGLYYGETNVGIIFLRYDDTDEEIIQWAGFGELNTEHHYEIVKSQRQREISRLFSHSLGTHPNLVTLVTGNIITAGSFYHHNTSYTDKGSHIHVRMSYDGDEVGTGNRGMKILEVKMDFDGEILEVIFPVGWNWMFENRD